MDLILWRHAEAADGSPDHSRILTVKGEKQARQMAAWLKKRLPEDTRILASPATRTLQTVMALTNHYETTAEVGIGASAANLLAAVGWPDAGGTVLVVGHQPTLGQVAALLLSGAEQECSIKKGAVWWLSNRVRRDETQTVLRCVMAAEML